MNLKKTSFFTLVIILLLTACGVPKNYQHAIYLNDSITEAQKTVLMKPTIIMPGDRLLVNITAVNKQAAEEFNASQTSGATPGYLVDSAGYVYLLQLGRIHVGGLTPEQVQQNLQVQLEDYIKGSLVTVGIANFRINVLGEVASPGILEVPEGKINILQAISKSGDLTLFAKRDSILIIRETNGKREFGRVDISSNQIFLSPYYNLQQNDVIYVEPDKTKFIANDYIMNRNIRNLGLIMTLVSFGLLLASIFN